MTRAAAPALVAGVLAVAAIAACGKKGNPLPPLRPVPSRVTDLSAYRVDRRVELRFTIPAANVDGSSPPAVSRVEIYRAPVPADGPPPSAATITGDADRLRAEIQVAPSDSSDPGDEASAADPVPGAAVAFVDEWPADETAVSGWSYLVVAVAGRDRRAAPSPIVTVPATVAPLPPDPVSVANDETDVIVSWPLRPSEQRFSVLEVTPDEAAVLTPQPIEGTELRIPVDFGRERCFVVRTVAVAGAAAVEGESSVPTCATAVDRYPPPAPAHVQAIQEGAAVTLNWTVVTADDLAGYVVLRGAPGAGELQRIHVDPVRETTFRDTTVTAGATYTYAVYAIDAAPTPNASPPSTRVVVTVR